MTTLDEIRVWRAHRNVAAFLRVIREGESAQTDAAYYMRYPNKRFDDFSKHPHIFEKTPNDTLSSAAGAYQITWTTWSELVQQYGFADFTPKTQDLACVALLARRDAITPLLLGDLDIAIARCRNEWTSLPGAAENHRVSLAKAHFVYEQYGGKYSETADAEQPAAPIEDRDLSRVPPRVDPATEPPPQGATRMDPISIISIFGPMISALIPQVGKLFGTGEVATRNQQTAQLVLDTVVKATNTPNVQAAVEAMQKDPAALEAATQAVITEPAIMGLLEIGGGVIAARQADHDATQGEKPFWFSPAFAITCLLVPLVYLVVSAVVFGLGGQWSDEMRSVVVTAIVTGLLGSISGYYLGSSLGSKSKDATIAQVKS